MYAHENAIKALQEHDKRAHAYRVLSPDRIDIAPRNAQLHNALYGDR